MKKILVIEDDFSLRKALSDKLKREGFEVFEANDGEKGLEIILNKKIDLIMLDILMPKMDGLTMYKKLKENFGISGIPTIILTNLDDGEKISEFFKIGVYDYLFKADWKLEDVINKVKEKLQ